MKGPQLKRMTIVIAVCALVGALAGIAGSAASPSKSKSKSKATQAQKKAAKARALRHAFRAGPAGPDKVMMGGPVHATAVVPNADGTGFETITEDSGTLLSVDGTTVHLKQGTDKATYKDDAAIDVGSDAKVIRNHQDAKLSDLKAGDHVHVITGGPKGNLVIAEDDAFLAQEKKDFEKGFRHHGFGPGFGPGGPPPGVYPGDKAGPSTQNGSDSGSTSSGGTNS